MDFKVLFITLMISHYKLSEAFDHHGFYNHRDTEENSSYEDDFSEEKTARNEETDSSPEESDKSHDDNLKNILSTTQVTVNLNPRYEVTEIIDDIPNNDTIRGPIVANFTLTVPLNNATVPINNTKEIATSNNGINNSSEDRNSNLRKNYFSIFHVKAEYDNDKPDVIIQNVTPNFPNFQGFKDYIYGFKKGIVNGLQSFGNKDKTPSEVNVNNSQVNNVVSAPIVFWNKLQRRSSDVAAKIHKAIFGDPFVKE